MEYDSPEAELHGALKILHKIFMDFKPRKCTLEVYGTDHSGQFFMVEVMNIRSIRPNLLLAPGADPGDGKFEVVLVPESHRDQFTDYFLNKISGAEDSYHFPILKGKDICVRWDGTRLHVDDKLLKQQKETEVRIKLKKGALQFLVPQMNQQTGKYIIVFGAIVIAVGAIVYFFGNKLSWIGRLPGDIRVERENFRFYFPITTMILFSLLLTVIVNVVRKFF